MGGMKLPLGISRQAILPKQQKMPSKKRQNSHSLSGSKGKCKKYILFHFLKDEVSILH